MGKGVEILMAKAMRGRKLRETIGISRRLQEVLGGKRLQEEPGGCRKAVEISKRLQEVAESSRKL